MTMRMSGLFPSEYDATTQALFNTLQGYGVSDRVLQEDMEFVASFFAEVGTSFERGIQDTMEVMDVAYIGLIYHRHMPFLDDETGEPERPDKAPNNYARTFGMLAQALEEQQGIESEQIVDAANAGADLAARNMRPSAIIETADLALQFTVIVSIGMVVHRLLPHTPNPPKGHARANE